LVDPPRRGSRFLYVPHRFRISLTVSPQVVRGKQSIRVECAPAFHYALAEHRTSLVPDETIPSNGDAADKQKKVVFESSDLTLDLRYVVESIDDGVPSPSVELQTLDLRRQGHKGIGISADLDLIEGQVVTFVLCTPPKKTRGQHIPNPTNDQAQRLGVSYDRELDLDSTHQSAFHL